MDEQRPNNQLEPIYNMDDRGGWQETVREISAGGTT